MSTVPAMPPIPAESMAPVSPPTELAPTIPDDMLYEMVDGQVVEKRMSARETEIASILVGLLTPYLRTNRLGRVVGEMLFRINPENDLRRRPDVAFVSHAALAIQSSRSQGIPLGYGSRPGHRSHQREQLGLRSPGEGSRVFCCRRVTRVWVVYPDQAEVYLYSSPTQIQVLEIGQELDGGDLLPGFHIPVAALFEDDPE